MFDFKMLEKIVGEENCLADELLSRHTTFHIGGEARYFAAPQYIEDFVEAAAYVRQAEIPYFIMGNGSNLLVYDTGYDGVILSTSLPGRVIKEAEGKLALNALLETEPEKLKKQGFLSAKELERLRSEAGDVLSRQHLFLAGSGLMLSAFANTVTGKGMAGFEFAGGIPGTVGGAVTMNAGAYGGEIRDCILGTKVLAEDGRILFLTKEELELGYRSSVIQKKGYIVLWGLFGFSPGDREASQERMREYNRRRREKQPLEYGSAGSTFKRPEGYFAGKLIEDAGLKGYRVGDVMISEKHCGFVVNVGEGTYDDARQVIEHTQKTVQEKFGVSLELEVKIVGGSL